ncbi:MAG: PDDEXK nuclease domain-containing protein [Limisphaerales bacterium]
MNARLKPAGRVPSHGAAPTGRKKLAQGKERSDAAPGHESKKTSSPERAKEGGELRAGWTRPDENPPVGLILCAEKNAAIAKYALEGLPNKALASEYKLNLPDEKLLAAEINKARKKLEAK